jgi:hypothetical protein
MPPSAPPTPIAVLGTLAEFHHEPIPYDLAALVRLVGRLHPDLLCLDMTRAQWERRDFGDLPPEYQEALLPLAHQTDIVVAPIGDEHSTQEPAAPGWRGKAIAALRGWLGWLHRRASGAEAVNSGWRHAVADTLYEIIGWLAGRGHGRLRQAHIRHLAQAVLEVARRDAGCRILVVLNVRYCHHIRRALKAYPELQVVNYAEL